MIPNNAEIFMNDPQRKGKAVQIFGETDGIAADAQSLDEISSNQAAAMNHLGSVLESCGTALQSKAGTVLQTIGADMKQVGLMFSAQFEEHSSKMTNNGVVIANTDDDAASLIGAAAVDSMSI